jgi:hypothetical protein
MDITYNINGGFKPTTKRFADMAGPDFFPTPRWATKALVDHEVFEGRVWECACGNGAMSEVLSEAGYDVTSSDLYDRGYGTGGVDFLASEQHTENVVTNPPYNAAEGFLHKALESSSSKVALLLRLAFLEGINRQHSIFLEKPPARVWVFSERITFYPAGAERKGSGTTAYAWFVWDKKSAGQTELKWLKTGYKAKYA